MRIAIRELDDVPLLPCMEVVLMVALVFLTVLVARDIQGGAPKTFLLTHRLFATSQIRMQVPEQSEPFLDLQFAHLLGRVQAEALCSGNQCHQRQIAH